MKQEVREKLISMSENKYKDFSSALVPNCGEMLGIRLPILRQYAKELAKSEGISALDGEDIYFEETMLRGMIIGALKLNVDEKLKYIVDFIPKIDNWSVCDSFCVSLKFTSKNKETVWNFLQPYLISDKEFYARFGAVMLLDYFVDDEYIERTLNALVKVPTKEFYSSMGVAWAVSVCYAKFPQYTRELLLSGILDDETYNRTIRKICDSYRVEKSDKDFLKTTIRKKEK